MGFDSTDAEMNPYFLQYPSVVSFSGGRSSGYLLAKIIEAHGRQLPDHVHVVFANTGKEHIATLEFVREVESRWCRIVWVERSDNEKKFAVKDFESASRNGEPFEQLIHKKKFLPNPVMRFCTSDLKVMPIKNYMKSIEVEEYTTVLGLRGDEPRRVARVTGDPSRDVVCPMATAGATRSTIMDFWKQCEFDLQLPNGDQAFGNCDLCFLKGRAPTDRVVRENPDSIDWWARMELESGGTFRKDRATYQQIRIQVAEQGMLFGDVEDHEGTLPCDCTE